MVNSADEPPLSSRLHSWAKNTNWSSLNPFRSSKVNPDNDSANTLPQHVGHIHNPPRPAATDKDQIRPQDTEQQGTSSVDTKGEGEKSTTIDEKPAKAPVTQRFIRDVKRIICCSWVNWLLIFVPVGIILGAIEDWGGYKFVNPSVIFAVNAVAIIPLASLLAFATESVATRLGDTIGALLNVTFGNAVELIVFVLALVAGEVRIVQAAAVGSILSNLLLILGMCFVLGGLRFREQLYNTSMSQTSACLLSLSMISLLLPTAFHAAFENGAVADRVVLKVSRGTSVVLLLVYCLYLLFSLKSHAFMYESTPQHVIDEESHPGVLADMLHSSSSSSDDSSSSSSDSDSSHTTAKRIKRALRRRRRKSFSSAKDGSSVVRASTISVDNTATAPSPGHDGMFSGDEADGENNRSRHGSRQPTMRSQDFETGEKSTVDKKNKKHRKSKKSKRAEPGQVEEKSGPTRVEQHELQPITLRFDVATDTQRTSADDVPRRPTHLRQLSAAVRPAFNSSVFPHHEAVGRSLAIPALRHESPRAPVAKLHRSSSMPDIRRQSSPGPRAASPHAHFVPHDVTAEVQAAEVWDPKQHLSRTSSIILLLVTTGLVALCAEFLVGSINYMVSSSGVSQAFIGLIILPIVGNAAEHVTAVTVAYKNKMDLSINIALGSSIQIALFVTPLMVMLGWAIGSDMSLYFTLFETMSLFASAFIVNYLMIDGRSNYLEGCLLIAAYVIIAIAAFFYPQCGADVSQC